MSSPVSTSCRGPVVLRVMSYNIRHGLGMDSRMDLDRIGAVIRDCKPDLVALQEVDCRAERSGKVDQAAELGRITGMSASFGMAMPLGGGEYGNAVLSRFPVVRVENHALPHSENREPRTVLGCRVRATLECEVLFASTHLDYLDDPTDRLMQAGELNRWFLDGESPVLLAGDFNAPWHDPSLRCLVGHWRNTAADIFEPSFPSDVPELRIDHILTAPVFRWEVLDVQVVNETVASDHRPVLTALALAVPRAS